VCDVCCVRVLKVYPGKLFMKLKQQKGEIKNDRKTKVNENKVRNGMEA
jgi:hypothetical protein